MQLPVGPDVVLGIVVDGNQREIGCPLILQRVEVLVLKLPSILVDQGDEGTVKLGIFLFGHGACLLFLAWFAVLPPRGRGTQAFPGAAGRRVPACRGAIF